MLNVKFDKSKIMGLIKPLNAISKIYTDDDGGIILNIDKESKEASVYVKKDSLGTLIFLKYKVELFKDAEIDQNEKIGILKIGDFIKYLSVIDAKDMSISFKDNVFTISDNAESDISFRVADCDMIKEGLKKFNGAQWYAELEVNENFDKLQKAMSALDNEDCVFIKGSQKDSKVTFTVRGSGMEMNKFKTSISTPVTQDFDIPFNKELIETSFNMPTDTIKLSISERFIAVSGETEFYNMTYYIAKKAVK